MRISDWSSDVCSSELGDENDLAEARPLLEQMGQRIVHCGGPGLGQAAKVCNNMILGVSQIVVAEAFVLGERLGLSHEALYEVAAQASGQCWALTVNCPVPGPVPPSPANRDRSEERRVGKECVSTGRSGRWPDL